MDLLAAGSTNQVRATKQATSTIPIVMRGVMDPVRRGVVTSLARPGGNVTGLTGDAALEVVGKSLHLLTEAVPTASRIATLHTPPAHASDPAPASWPNLLETARGRSA